MGYKFHIISKDEMLDMNEDLISKQHLSKFFNITLNVSVVLALALTVLGTFVYNLPQIQLILHWICTFILVLFRVFSSTYTNAVVQLFLIVVALTLSLSILSSGNAEVATSFIFFPLLIIAATFLIGPLAGLATTLLNIALCVIIWSNPYGIIETTSHPYSEMLHLSRSVAACLAFVVSYLFSFYSKSMVRELGSHYQEESHRQRVSAIEILSGGFAHEISNPLAITKGCLSILEKPDLDETNQLKWLKKAQSAVRRLEDIIHSVRTLSGKARNKAHDTVNLDEALTEALFDLNEKLDKANITIEAIGNEKSIKCNRMHLTFILKIMLDDALSAIVGAENTSGFIKVEYRHSDKGSTLIVQNNGHQQSRAQSRFFEAYFSIQDHQDQKSIGMSIVNTIIDLYGWRISTDSCEDLYTCRILMPV